MASSDEHALRLRAYLVALTPQARRRLRDGLVHGPQAGTVAAGAALAELDRLDTSEDGVAARLFFQPIEPFLTDGDPAQACPGCIARHSTPALWAWICNDLLPQEAAAFMRAATEALEAGAAAHAHALTEAFQDRVAAALRAVFGDENAAARDLLLRRVGTPRAADEAATLRWILRGRDRLAALGARLPATIDHLPPQSVPACLALIDDTARPREVFAPALVAFMQRLVRPWQIVRLAAHAGGSNSAARIEASPYGIVIDMLLGEVERQIARLSASLADGEGAIAVGLIRSIDAILQGLRSEIAIPRGSTLGRRLQALSAEAAAMTRSAMAA